MSISISAGSVWKVSVLHSKHVTYISCICIYIYNDTGICTYVYYVFCFLFQVCTHTCTNWQNKPSEATSCAELRRSAEACVQVSGHNSCDVRDSIKTGVHLIHIHIYIYMYISYTCEIRLSILVSIYISICIGYNSNIWNDAS